MKVFGVVVVGLIAGGAAGAGVGSGLYPPVVGVSLAILIGAATGFVIWRRARAGRATHSR